MSITLIAASETLCKNLHCDLASGFNNLPRLSFSWYIQNHTLLGTRFVESNLIIIVNFLGTSNQIIFPFITLYR